MMPLAGLVICAAAAAAVESLSSVQFFVTPWPVAPRLLCPQDFPGKSIAVGRHFLLQGFLLMFTGL